MGENRIGRNFLITLAFAIIALLIGFPLAIITSEAFSQGFQAFVRLAQSDEARHAVILTLIVASCTVVVNAVIGLLVAWTLTKYRFPGKALLTTIVDLPLSVSPVVIGLSVVFAFGEHSVIGGWLVAHGIKVVFALPGLIIATIFVTFPFIAREVTALMDEQGRELEEAALLMGASPWQTFWRVSFPNVRWALANGIILCAARAMGEFGAVSVVSGRIRGVTETMPLHIEALYNDYDLAGAFAMSLILVLITLATILARILLQIRHERLREAASLQVADFIDFAAGI